MKGIIPKCQIFPIVLRNIVQLRTGFNVSSDHSANKLIAFTYFWLCHYNDKESKWDTLKSLLEI